jgi:general nucleoside transport system permease protein
MTGLAPLIAATLSAATPLALAALGLLVNERAGVVNLGAEGIMLIGAVSGFAVGLHSANDWLGFGAGAMAGAFAAAALAWLVVWLNANQYAAGLALSLFGNGFSAFVGIDYVGRKLHEGSDHSLPLLRDLPLLGPALFRQHPMVYLTMLAVAGVAFFLYRTRAGLVLRAIGENPEAANALGYPVRLIRLAALVFGGALCGASGAYLSLIYAPLWVEGMVAGRGWIALALTVFATWRPARVLFGAWLFGGVTMLQLNLQAQGVQLPAEFMAMLPYLSCVLVLVLISRNPLWIRLNMPASLGKPFFPGS